jgi:hypothetical protein
MNRGRLRRPLATIGAALAVWAIVGKIHLSRLVARLRAGQSASGAPTIEVQIRRELLSWPV